MVSYNYSMEFKPLLLQFTNPNPRCKSQMGTDCFDFEFPTATCGSAVPSDVVLFGKVISRKTQPRRENKKPLILKPKSFLSRFDVSVRSMWNGENRWRMIESQSRRRSRKHWNGLFGMVKFPLQMELSDIKMRQERRMPLRLPLPKPEAENDGVMVIVRPLGQRRQLLKAFAKATFGRCFPIV